MQKTILITGATSGFGKECARLFASDGWKLILTGRRADRLEALQDELNAECHILVQDVREREAVEKDLAGLPEGFRDIDVLVNNAGLALGMGPAQEADLDQWEEMVDTNIKGLMYCTRFVLPGMVKRGSGHIVNIGSVAGNWPYPGGNVYGASKAFVKQFSNNLRADVLGSGVRVTNIEPGLAETEFSVVRFNGDAKKAAEVYAGTEPLTAADIAEMVHWAVTRPPHVNVNRIEVMPVCQSCGPFAIDRKV
ncbi:MAG: SDR family oxidoreductase [Proteobacteria bacterium]|nr:SDR family oxidoreductase [Pseudomonadota bacterium]MBU1738900.1 SDR family oxidoreductase [Pseudomonadota bacterium]